MERIAREKLNVPASPCLSNPDEVVVVAHMLTAEHDAIKPNHDIAKLMSASLPQTRSGRTALALARVHSVTRNCSQKPLWTDALSISKMSPNLCLSKPHSEDDVTSVMLAIISATFL